MGLGLVHICWTEVQGADACTTSSCSSPKRGRPGRNPAPDRNRRSRMWRDSPPACWCCGQQGVAVGRRARDLLRPMAPAAPPRFSTMTGCPASRASATRAAPPHRPAPAGGRTTMRSALRDRIESEPPRRWPSRREHGRWRSSGSICDHDMIFPGDPSHSAFRARPGRL